MKASSLCNFEKAKMEPLNLESDPKEASSNFKTSAICGTYQSKFSTDPLAKTEHNFQPIGFENNLNATSLIISKCETRELSTELSSKNEMDSHSLSFHNIQNLASTIKSISETRQFEFPAKPLHKEEQDFRHINIENSPNVASLIKSVSNASEEK